MKKILLLSIIILFVVFITGCKDEESYVLDIKTHLEESSSLNLKFNIVGKDEGGLGVYIIRIYYNGKREHTTGIWTIEPSNIGFFKKEGYTNGNVLLLENYGEGNITVIEEGTGLTIKEKIIIN